MTQCTPLRDIAPKIAAHLPGWRFDELNTYTHLIYFIGPNNERFHIGQARSRGKLSVSGCYPDIHNRKPSTSGRGSDYDCVRKSDGSTIGLSISKGPAAIAQDIKNRFIPVFVALLHLAKIERLAFIDKCNIMLNRVALAKKIAPGLWDENRRNKHDVKYNHQLRGPVNNNVHATIDFSALSKGVNLSMSGLTDEQAIKVLAVLNEGT